MIVGIHPISHKQFRRAGSNGVQSWRGKSLSPRTGYSKELQFSIFSRSEIFPSTYLRGGFAIFDRWQDLSTQEFVIDVGLRVSIEGLAARPSDPAGRRSYLRQ